MTTIVIPRAQWLSRRIAELDADVEHFGQIINRLNGRVSFDAECALEDALRERAEYRRELNANTQVTP